MARGSSRGQALAGNGGSGISGNGGYPNLDDFGEEYVEASIAYLLGRDSPRNSGSAHIQHFS